MENTHHDNYRHVEERKKHTLAAWRTECLLLPSKYGIELFLNTSPVGKSTTVSKLQIKITADSRPASADCLRVLMCKAKSEMHAHRHLTGKTEGLRKLKLRSAFPKTGQAPVVSVKVNFKVSKNAGKIK